MAAIGRYSWRKTSSIENVAEFSSNFKLPVRLVRAKIMKHYVPTATHSKFPLKTRWFHFIDHLLETWFEKDANKNSSIFEPNTESDALKPNCATKNYKKVNGWLKFLLMRCSTE